MNYLTQEEYQQFAPSDLTDFNTTLFIPLANDATKVVFNGLPKSMVAVIKEQAPLEVPFAALPELKEFWNDLCKDWISKQVWLDQLRVNGVNVTPEGTRTYTSPNSNETDQNKKDLAVNMVAQKLNQCKRAALNDYTDRRYIYDGVAYPPTRNMDGLWADWMGSCNYWNGPNGWGWYNGAGYQGWAPSFGAKQNQTFGVTFLGGTPL